MKRSAAQRRGVPRGRRGVASVGALAIAASLLTYAAVTSRGSTVHEADVGDGGVWVSSSAQAKFARLNTGARQLDAGVSAALADGSKVDILQDGAAVVGVATGNTLLPIDVRTATSQDSGAAAPVRLPDRPGRFTPATVDLRGGTLAAVDPKTGKVWAQRVDTKQGVEQLQDVGATAKPLATIGGNASLAVDVDGTVVAASGATGRVVTIAPGSEGMTPPVTVGTDVRAAMLDVTAVGDTWVLYDPDKDELHVEGRDEPVSAGAALGSGPAYAALQQPGPKADTVVLANAVSTRTVRLAGGDAPGGVEVQEQANRSVEPPVITRPVVLRGCLHAAWAETGNVFYGANCGRSDVVAAGTLGGASAGIVRDGVAFRVNRGAIVLNQLDTGDVWDVDSTKQKIDNWDALIPPTKKDDDNDKKDENVVDDNQVSQPPKAIPDNLRVRPGRTSKIHPLDNDTDALGSILSIDPRDLTAPSASDVRADVSSDGQSVDVTVPARPSATTISFSYKVSNGKAKEKGSAKIVLTVVPDEVNTPPKLREGRADLARTVYPVVSGGRVAASVLGDWRDGESDPLSVDTADDTTIIDGQGRVGITAPVDAGPATRRYLVNDGRLNSKGEVNLQVLDPAEPKAVPPKTQPDVIRAVLGKPVQLEPLGNDIPGADPGDPDARLRLAGEVAPTGPLDVDTNLTTGVVTITPNGLGTTELAYAAQSGGTVTPGRIRIDTVEPADPEAPPVAVPDGATLRDQAPTMVDVLANDYSPRADVVVTQSTHVDADNGWLRPTIYQGRWVRIEALEPSPVSGTGNRQGTIEYTISDGSKRTTGTINVVQRPPVAGAAPTVEDDLAAVREADSVSVGVLDNDTMADGIPLVLAPDSVKVITEGAEQRAFASGNLIRYVPEFTGLTAPKDVVIEYSAYAEGSPERAKTGRLTVTVNPLPSKTSPNQAPVARSFASSVTSGESVTLTIPSTGVDPDGDTVTMRGITGKDADALELTHGRVVSIGPSTIRYEGYPNAAGTELIRYEVQDRFGATSQAFVRVGVVRPGDPQPPVAVEDEIVAAPGKRITAHVLRNDLIARGDSVRLDHKDLNPAAVQKQWTVDEDESTISTVAPEPDAPTHQFVYGIDNGIFDPSRTTVLVRGVKGHLNPPIAQDDVARATPGQPTALVDVLANDTDIDSDPATLKIVDILSEHGRTEDGKVRVTLLDHPQTVPYVIEDDDGARALALIHVPAGDNGLPFVVEGALIEMDKDSTKTVKLDDYVKSPRSKALSITAAATVAGSPREQLAARGEGSDALTLTSSGGYIGPGAVTVEVSDQATSDDKDVRTAYVSIPVQVGPKVPLLRCPEAPLVVAAGGRAREVDIPTYCRAWLPVGMGLDDVDFGAKWDPQPDGTTLEQAETGGRLLTVSAGDRAPSGTGSVTVTSPGMPSVKFPVRVLGRDGDGETTKADSGTEPAPVMGPPRLRPISVDGLNEGESTTIDVRAYLDSPLAKPSCTITAAALESGQGIELSRDGCTLSLRATSKPSPTATISLLVSDGPGRQASGRVTVTLRGKPTAPTGVSAVADRIAGGQARVSWNAPSYDGGTTISRYLVRFTGGSSGTQECGSSPCTITKLKNGEDYTFTVVARNAIGDSPPSAPSNVVQPDIKPEATTGVHLINRGDRTLQIGWSPAPNKGSTIRKYVVRLVPTATGGAPRTVEVAGGATRTTASGLDNNTPYSVSVQAWNNVGAGPFGPAVQMQSAGTPPAVSGISGRTRGPGAGHDSESVTVSWSQQTNPNGPPLKHYTIYRNLGGGGWTRIGQVGAQTRTFADTIPYDGQRYGYTVTATNGADKESPKGSGWTYTSNGVPTTPKVQASTPKANKSIVVDVTVGKPRSGGFSSIRWSSGGKSGTHACGCAAGSTVRFTIPGAGISPQSVSVTTVNSGGKSSAAARSGQVQPFGETLAPKGLSATVKDRTITWRWNLVTNGRPVDQVQVSIDGGAWGPPSGRESHSQTFGFGQAHGLRVRAHATPSGWGPPSAGVRATTENQPRSITRTWTKAGCVGDGGQPCVAFSVSGFTPGTYSVIFNHSSVGGNHPSPTSLRVGSNGEGTWAGKYWVARYGTDLAITFNGPQSFTLHTKW